MAKDVITNEQQDQQSQRSGSSQTRSPQTAGSQTSGAQSTRPSPLLFPVSPFALLNPFTMMRRVIEVMDPDYAQGAVTERMWSPAVEVCKTNGTYVVRAELPGVTPEDVKVEVVENVLELDGDRKYEREENAGDLYRSERQYGHFHRSIPLPEGAKVDQVRANFTNGVLEIEVPVSAEQTRQIPIETKSASTASNPQGTSSAAPASSSQQRG